MKNKSGLIKVMIAEDHTYLRKTLAKDIQEIGKIFDVIGQAGNGEDLIELIKKNEPDIVLLDIRMPIMDGHEALEIINNDFPAIKTIVISFDDVKLDVIKALSFGARAYLKKDDQFEIMSAIEQVYKGGYYYNKSVSEEMIHSLAKLRKKNSTVVNNVVLSDRELQILQLIYDNKTNRQIAALLFISYHTVIYHKKSLFKKTGCNSTVSLIRFAAEQGLVS